MGEISEAQKKSLAKYRAAKRKQIQLDYSIEEFDRIKQHCESIQTPVATWCKEVIHDAIERETINR